MPTPGPLELVIILVVALLVLGPGKLPEVGSALGKSIREFRKAASDVQEATKIDVSPLPPTPAAAAPVAPPPTPAPVVSAPLDPIVAAPAVTTVAAPLDPIVAAPAVTTVAAPVAAADPPPSAAPEPATGTTQPGTESTS
jgi:TatA/E family protein of Tat protein translocase